MAGPVKTAKTATTAKTGKKAAEAAAPVKGAKPTTPTTVLTDLERTRINSLIPHPSDFAHVSKTHGQAHVGRTMVHAFRFIDATGNSDEASRLWGAVYLHDLARTHDGFDEVHGMHAVIFPARPFVAGWAADESTMPSNADMPKHV